jgi:N-acetylmuramate 1-kinase
MAAIIWRRQFSALFPLYYWQGFLHGGIGAPATEKNHEFVNISQILASAHVLAPHVIAVNYEQGYILQNDFGDLLLRSMLTDNTVDIWYGKAMQQLQQMLLITPEQCAQLPDYNTSALFLELSYFKPGFSKPC